MPQHHPAFAATFKNRQPKTIESLGYIDELEKEYDDPIAYFEEKIRQMSKQQNAEQFVNVVMNPFLILLKNFFK